jgi:transposase-like protein
MLGEGKTISEAAKELGISEQTYHRWRNQYGGMKADDAKRLKELERGNRQLKAIVADQVPHEVQCRADPLRSGYHDSHRHRRGAPVAP